jgi:hypothetical protein
MGKFIITENEKKRILGLYLLESEEEITLVDGIEKRINKNPNPRVQTILPPGLFKSYTVLLNGEEIMGASPQTATKYGYVGSKEGGLLNVVIPDDSDKAYVMNINIPENLRGKGIGAKIYQAVADKINRTVISSGDDDALGMIASQTPASQSFWRKHNSFEPN